jgi:hypothetical protein
MFLLRNLPLTGEKFTYDGPDIGFDRAMSIEVDSSAKQKP